MSRKEKPLPKPRSTPFGRKRPHNEGESREPLMADQMAMAMTEGKLGEYLEKEMPDSEYGRKLAEMMMGMTGMLPPEGFPGMPAQKKHKPSKTKQNTRAKKSSRSSVPGKDVVNAVRSGNVDEVIDLLKREHEKRSPGPGSGATKKERKESPSHSPAASLEKEIVDQMIRISRENGLSLDWILLRALKRYIQEYRKTGSL